MQYNEDTHRRVHEVLLLRVLRCGLGRERRERARGRDGEQGHIEPVGVLKLDGVWEQEDPVPRALRAAGRMDVARRGVAVLGREAGANGEWVPAKALG